MSPPAEPPLRPGSPSGRAAPPPSRRALLDRLDSLAEDAERLVVGTELAPVVADVRLRLRRPLRVALAGRTKAGKSTLLNALVGERLAATDATECTRIVTWYRYDLGYAVEAVLRNGERRSLEFDRSAGLSIRLGALSLGEIDRLEVGWPSSRLAELTLIDTPGLDGTGDAGARATEALQGDESDSTDAADADAVVYLMRHLHRRDAEFLEAFDAGSIAIASPVNAVGLLSRADEIGAGRPDALESSARVAERYAADPRVAGLVLTVLPVTGLLAETGATLREDEVAALRQVATLEAVMRDDLLLSVDRFRSRDENPLAADVREDLLARLGLFGLRLCIRLLQERPAVSAPELAQHLVDASGIRSVESLIRRHFAERADTLKARSALARLRAVANWAAIQGLPGASTLTAAVERTEAGSAELRQLRLLHLVRARIAELADDERAEVERVLGFGSVAERLGEPVGTRVPELRAASLAAIERWRGRAGSPLVDRRTAEAAEGMARAYEGLFTDLERLAART